MSNNPSESESREAEIEALKKTTRISLDEVLSAAPPQKKATASLAAQGSDKSATGPISGIPTHTAPIPQTIRLKRPATSPIVINPSDIATAPTVVKFAHGKAPTVHEKLPTGPAGEAPTVIKQPLPPRPLNETSRIILEIDQPDTRIKTAPISAAAISATEPTPSPKTIRLKRPSTILTAAPPAEPQPVPSEIQAAKKSETSKIELPKEAEALTPATQRKTIKIKRTDRNIIPRTVAMSRPAATKPQAATAIPTGAAAPVHRAPVQPVPEEEALPVFSILAGAAVVCLALLVYLLTSQAFGPKLILPIPSGLF
jgi:hypothetical protein